MGKEPQKATIYEVSRRAKASIVTVSRVFNNYPHVSSRMRARVLAAARDVGYKPRVVAKRRILAVILGHLDALSAGDYKARLVFHIVRRAAERGLMVEFIPFETTELATSRHVDAVVVVGLTESEVEHLGKLPRGPRVLTNMAPRRGWINISSDHRMEGVLATQHLVEKGHTRIALVLDERHGWGPSQRAAGYEAVLRQYLGDAAEPLILSAEEGSPREIGERLLGYRCTAAILLSDNAGLAVVDALVNEQGARIPGTLSVVGIENEGVSAFLTPRLTTIQQPLAEMAEALVESVDKALEGKSTPSQLFESALVVRDSVGPVSAG